MNKTAKTVKEYVLITAGTVLLSAGVYLFKIPNGFATGGVSGIGTLLGKITPLSPATWISVLNVALLILAFAVLGRSTGARTVYCSLLFSGLTELFELVFPMSGPLTDDPLLELVYAMLLSALGSAMIFWNNASSGGTDIIALILKKYTQLNVGRALLCVDFLIAASSFLVFGVKIGMYSLLGLFAKAFLVDSIIESIGSCKYFTIVTTHPEEISEYITTEMHHSATLVRSTGAYTGNDSVMLHTVCHRAEALRLRKKIKEIDKFAFVVVTTSSEILGKGFRGV